MEMLIATSNKGKIREFSEIIGGKLGIDIISIYNRYKDFIMPKETGKTFEENAEIKAYQAYKVTKRCSIADDSGLEVDALNGAPGIYSARYAGDYADDNNRINKILYNMEGIPYEKRTAKFVCVICCVLPEGDKIFSRGECQGKITTEVRGNGGFGYDSIFLTSTGKTFAELSEYEKNEISHRGVALRNFYFKLKDKIKEYKI